MKNYRIIKKNYEFDRVYKRGKQCHSAELSLFFFKRKDDDLSRVGVTVSRAITGAVKRNRVKRVLRELFRTNAEAVRPGFDCILHGKKYPEPGSYKRFERAFFKVLKKAKLWQESGRFEFSANQQKSGANSSSTNQQESGGTSSSTNQDVRKNSTDTKMQGRNTYQLNLPSNSQ